MSQKADEDVSDWEDDGEDVGDVDSDDIDLDELADSVENKQATTEARFDTSAQDVETASDRDNTPSATLAIDAEKADTLQELSQGTTSEIQPASPRDAPAVKDASTSGASSEGWAWGPGYFGAAWNSITTAIQEDVQDISHSFQRALDNVKEEIRTPIETDTSAQGTGRSDGVVSAEDVTFRETDQELQDGLQAIDDQVDKLASGAAKAFGSLWSGLGGAINSGLATAGNVASRVEHAAFQAASNVIEHVEKPRSFSPRSTPSQPRSRHGAGTWDLLRRVGMLLEGQDSSYAFADASGLSEDDWDTIHNLDAPENAAAVSFEQLFKVYRGHRFEEELEDLGNEAAKECNRARTAMSAAQQAELDATMARLAAIVDLAASLPPSNTQESASAAVRGVIGFTTASCDKNEGDLAEKGYAALAGLCSAAVQRANLMGERALQSFMQTLATDEAAQGQGDPEALHDAWSDVQDKLFLLRAEGLKLIAELTALAMQHLISIATSLQPHAEDSNDSQPAPIIWPKGDEERGAAVKTTIQQLLADVDATCRAFCTALELVGHRAAAMLTKFGLEPDRRDETPASPTDDYSGTTREWTAQLASITASLITGLRSDSVDACEKLIATSKHLMYPVCAACIRHLMQDAEQASLNVDGDGHDDGAVATAPPVDAQSNDDVSTAKSATMTSAVHESASASQDEQPRADAVVSNAGETREATGEAAKVAPKQEVDPVAQKSTHEGTDCAIKAST